MALFHPSGVAFGPHSEEDPPGRGKALSLADVKAVSRSDPSAVFACPVAMGAVVPTITGNSLIEPTRSAPEAYSVPNLTKESPMADAMTVETAHQHATIDDRYMTRGEAAEYVQGKYRFACSAFLLKKLASVGGGPARIKAGVSVVYLKSDLDAWAKARMRRIEDREAAA